MKSITSHDNAPKWFMLLMFFGMVVLMAALSGCQSAGPITVQAPAHIDRAYLRDIVPPSAMKCLREPDGSSVKSIRQSAKYIIDLKKAGADCRQKLEVVKGVIETEK